MMRARTVNKTARERALAGSPSARLTNETNWQPMIDWLTERDNDGNEIPEDDGIIFNVNPGLEV